MRRTKAVKLSHFLTKNLLRLAVGGTKKATATRHNLKGRFTGHFFVLLFTVFQYWYDFFCGGIFEDFCMGLVDSLSDLTMKE